MSVLRKGGANVENASRVDQPLHPALARIAAQPQIFARQGAVVATWRAYRDRTSGPYYELSYRDGRRQMSVYLGREGPLVEQVRQMLAELQSPLRRLHAYRRTRKEVRRMLHGYKAGLNQALRALGLRMKGYEVRGWRSAPVLRKRGGLTRLL